MNSQFKIGRYRPIYLWGGPGTIRMNKIKFMDYPVDEEIHHQAHAAPAAQLVVHEMNTNWVHLTYDWGFPPEIEEQDWEDFRKAAKVYHDFGSPVFAYIQTSNCVFDGSFTDKDWYAKNIKGQKIYYYSGRYMTDWTHPEWIQHLKNLIEGALERGADGIFLDNLWYGEGPNGLMGAWLGGAGCYCERCQTLYQEATGQTIPKKILPHKSEVADYLRWRAGRVTATVQELADFTHSLKPDAPISANDYDITMRNSYLIFGIDVEALAKIQDVIMVENFALPRWDPKPKSRLANNALTIRNTREFVGDHAHLSVLSYDVGIGFDPVYSSRRYQQGIGEAAACGVSMTIKGTEYNDGKRMTLLIDPTYHPQRKAIGDYNRWLEKHQELYQDRTNAAPIGLLHPEEELWRHWPEISPVIYGAAQTLTAAGLPWRVVRRGHSSENLLVLLTFTPYDRTFNPKNAEIQTIHVPAIPSWAWKRLNAVAKGGVWHDLVESLSLFLLRSYHSSKLARRLMDKLNMAKLVTQTTLFNLPEPEVRLALLDLIPRGVTPNVSAEEPVLIENWLQNGGQQVHLLNYGSDPQQVRINFERNVTAHVLSPDINRVHVLNGSSLNINLDIYSVLLIK